MDIVLEVLDTYAWDYLYAALYPAKASHGAFEPASNATVPLTSWEYTPATKYLYLEPSEAAYQSAWPRDNIYRQGISLFLITWYAHHRPSVIVRQAARCHVFSP
jgi:lathosterol oxidase